MCVDALIVATQVTVGWSVRPVSGAALIPCRTRMPHLLLHQVLLAAVLEVGPTVIAVHFFDTHMTFLRLGQ